MLIRKGHLCPGVAGMKWLKFFAACLFLSALVLVAQRIPAGTTLPVMLNSPLDTKKNKPGEKVSARIMQDIPLPDGTRIPAGTGIVGHILQVNRSTATSGSRLVLKFDQLVMHGHFISLTTSLRVIASMMDVYEAQIPTNAWDDYGTSYNDWNTVQVGGDAVYRGNGQVIAADNQVLGRATIGGDVTAKLTAVPDRGCRGAIHGNDRAQALWIFSTSACGAYGFRDLKIAHAGRSDPIGEIVLESSSNVQVSGGSGLLLRVDTPVLR